MTTNKLRIRAKALDLDLAGEHEYIVQAYDAIKPVLMERFAESIDVVFDDDPTDPDGMNVQTLRMHAAVDPKKFPSPPPDDDTAQHLNVVVCNEVYNKIYLMERDTLDSSIFGRAIDPHRVTRVFVNRSQTTRFDGQLEFGKVLWRELTTAGKKAVKKG